MTHKKQALSLAAIAWLFLCLGLLLFGGCERVVDDRTTNITTPPPPTEPVILDRRGNCAAEFDTVTCCDESASRPAGAIAEVVWELMRSRTNVPHEATGDAGECVTFGGVSPGTYTPRQTVTATDGGSVRGELPPVTVGGAL